MREHPIPQDITGYKFHIIGNMTIKQFAEVAAGVIVSLFFYATNLPDIIKWPIIFFCFGLGLMVAFVPIEERPLDHWLITFVKILYKPTKFYWKRDEKIPEAFLYEAQQEELMVVGEVDLSPARRQRIEEYLRSLEGQKGIDEWELAENEKINAILQNFKTVRVADVQAKQMAQKPKLSARVRSLSLKMPTTEETVIFEQRDVVVQGQTPLQPEEIAQQKARQTKKQLQQVEQVAAEVSVPQLEKISVEHTQAKEAETEKTTEELQAEMAFLEKAPQQQQAVKPTQQAALNVNLPFPSMPKEPNRIVGMVLSQNSDLITDAIVEIKTSTNQIVRAIKTNPLGQFFITTPLQTGSYIIDVEKNGLQFPSQQIELTGEIIPPVEIRSVS